MSLYPLGFPQYTVQQIREVVAAEYGVTLEQIDSGSRNPMRVVPRLVAMALCSYAGHSTTDTAKAFDDRDHTCVINAKRRVQFWMRESTAFANAITEIAKRLGIELEQVAA